MLLIKSSTFFFILLAKLNKKIAKWMWKFNANMNKERKKICMCIQFILQRYKNICLFTLRLNKMYKRNNCTWHLFSVIHRFTCLLHFLWRSHLHKIVCYFDHLAFIVISSFFFLIWLYNTQKPRKGSINSFIII